MVSKTILILIVGIILAWAISCVYVYGFPFVDYSEPVCYYSVPNQEHIGDCMVTGSVIGLPTNIIRQAEDFCHAEGKEFNAIFWNYETYETQVNCKAEDGLIHSWETEIADKTGSEVKHGK